MQNMLIAQLLILFLEHPSRPFIGEQSLDLTSRDLRLHLFQYLLKSMKTLLEPFCKWILNENASNRQIFSDQ